MNIFRDSRDDGNFAPANRTAAIPRAMAQSLSGPLVASRWLDTTLRQNAPWQFKIELDSILGASKSFVECDSNRHFLARLENTLND